jgi:hypothetical protein
VVRRSETKALNEYVALLPKLGKFGALQQLMKAE